MIGVLNTNSFLYMIAIEAFALAGLFILLMRKKFGFYIYVFSQFIFILYPLVSGTADTVFGLLILPIIGIPLAFIFYYYKNTDKLQA
jgi:hypothetical protein